MKQIRRKKKPILKSEVAANFKMLEEIGKIKPKKND
jgi:hypothetical protein